MTTESALLTASFCLMFGQGRALRGEGMEAIDVAIVNLQEKSHQCFKFFMFELLFFHISSFLLMWIYYRFLVALIINIILGLFLILFVKNGYEIYSELWIDEQNAVSSKFKTFQDDLIDLDKKKEGKGYNQRDLQALPPILPAYGVCVMEPHGSGSGVMGVIKFTQVSPLGVQVSGSISGLSANTEHGFHIHDFGDIQAGCASFGGHYNPLGQRHGGRTDTVRHVGDFGNIMSDSSGVATFSFVDNRISLISLQTIMGRGCVVHAMQDDLGRGNNAASALNGNSGARLACGIVGRAAAPAS
eukprot:403341927